MPTDNPKISSYVPQVVFGRFKKFQEQHNLSMSQAVILILAEYFGLEENIKESTKGTTIGGVTLDRVEKLEEELNSLKKITKLNSELLNSLQENIQVKIKVDNEETTSEPLNSNLSSPQLELLSDLPQDIKPLMSKTLSELRFKLAKDTVSGHKRKDSTEEFTEWTKEHDPDRIAWKYVELPTKGYLPEGELSSEQKSNLLEWIEKNIG